SGWWSAKCRHLRRPRVPAVNGPDCTDLDDDAAVRRHVRCEGDASPLPAGLGYQPVRFDHCLMATALCAPADHSAGLVWYRSDSAAVRSCSISTCPIRTVGTCKRVPERWSISGPADAGHLQAAASPCSRSADRTGAGDYRLLVEAGCCERCL